MEGRCSIESLGNLLVLWVVWFSLCTGMRLQSSNNEPVTSLTLTTHTFGYVCKNFSSNFLGSLFTWEGNYITVTSETFIHCGSKFIYPEVWGCLGGHDEERRKRSFQILHTNHITILCQIKPQASLWLLSVQRSSTWLPGDWARICLFSGVIHECVMGDTQRIKMSRQAKNMSDSDVCYSSAVTFFFF